MTPPWIGPIALAARVDSMMGISDAGPARLTMLARLTDAELAEAWVSSCDRLAELDGQARPPSTHTALGLERSWYLDELERRAPDAFAVWMSAGALPHRVPGRARRQRPSSG